MQKHSIVWLTVAASMVLTGCIIFIGAMSAMEWNFSKLSTNKYETNQFDLDGNVSDISIITDTADITFLPAKELKCSVVCYEEQKTKHSVSVKDGILSIELEDTRKWYDFIGIFNFTTPKITVYLPQGGYGTLSIKGRTGDIFIPEDFIFDSMHISQSTGNVTNFAPVYEGIKIRTTTGDICVENVSAQWLDLTVSTGHITVSNVICDESVSISVSTGKSNVADLECKEFKTMGSTGDVSLTDVIAVEKISVERSTGDIKFDSCDAGEIIVTTDTGDIFGTLLTEKIFITQTDTGRVIVPETTSGGKCRLITDTGDIRLEIVSNNSQ